MGGHSWACPGGSVGGVCNCAAGDGEEQAKLDPMKEPLPCAAPNSIKGREDRTRWVLENFTNDELHELFKLAHDAKGVRYSSARGVIERARKGMPA